MCARSRARAQCTIYYEYAFPDSDAQQAEFDAVRLACLLNSSACALRLRRPTEALEHASKAVYAEPRSAKALFRRAQAGRALDDLDAAARDAAAALALAPEDPALRREAALIAGKRRAYWGREAAMNRRMLGGGGGGGGGSSGAVEVGDGAGDGSDSGSEGEGAAAGDVPIEVRCAVCVCMLCVVCEFVCSRARTHNFLGAAHQCRPARPRAPQDVDGGGEDGAFVRTSTLVGAPRAAAGPRLRRRAVEVLPDGDDDDGGARVAAAAAAPPVAADGSAPPPPPPLLAHAGVSGGGVWADAGGGGGLAQRHVPHLLCGVVALLLGALLKCI